MPQMVDLPRNVPNSSAERFMSMLRPLEIMSTLYVVMFEPLHGDFKLTVNCAKKKYIVPVQHTVVIQFYFADDRFLCCEGKPVCWPSCLARADRIQLAPDTRL